MINSKELVYLNVILSFAAILISIWNVNVTVKNDNFMQREVSPAFRISTYKKNGKMIDELINIKGFVNNLSFKKYEEITLILPNFNYVMQYHCANVLEEKAANNRWPYQSICRDNLGERIVESLQGLKSNYNVEIHSIYSLTYYEVVYQDYKNELHSEIYSKNSNNTLILKNERNNSPMGRYCYTPFDLSDEFIEKEAMRVLQMLEEWQKLNYINAFS